MTEYSPDTNEQKTLTRRLNHFRRVTGFIEKAGYGLAGAVVAIFIVSFLAGPQHDRTPGTTGPGAYVSTNLRRLHEPGSDKVYSPSRSQLEGQRGLIDKIAGTANSNFSEAEKIYLRAQVCSYRRAGPLELACSPQEDMKWLVENSNEVQAFADPYTMAILERMHLGKLQSPITAGFAQLGVSIDLGVRIGHAVSRVAPFVIFPLLLLGFSYVRFFRSEVIRQRLSSAIWLPDPSLMENLALLTFDWMRGRPPSRRLQAVAKASSSGSRSDWARLPTIDRSQLRGSMDNDLDHRS